MYVCTYVYVCMYSFLVCLRFCGDAFVCMCAHVFHLWYLKDAGVFALTIFRPTRAVVCVTTPDRHEG